MQILFGRAATCALVCGVLALSSVARAVVGGTTVLDSETRLDAVGLMLTVISGAAPECGGWISGTCTLVGPDLVMLARHSVAVPGAGLPTAGTRTNRVRFRRGTNGGASNHYVNDCAAPFQEIFVREFISSQAVGLDVVLARLESAPIGIMPITPEINFAFTGNAPITMAGWGYDGLCIQSGDAWTLRTKDATLPPNAHLSSCCFDYNAATMSGACYSTATANRWAIGNTHDSGAPILIEVTVNGRAEWRLVGVVNSTMTATNVAAWNAFGGMPRLPVIFPIGCPADVNSTGSLSVQDIFDYLAAYFDGGFVGDFDGSGTITVQDIFLFIQAFFAGC